MPLLFNKYVAMKSRNKVMQKWTDLIKNIPEKVQTQSCHKVMPLLLSKHVAMKCRNRVIQKWLDLIKNIPE